MLKGRGRCAPLTSRGSRPVCTLGGQLNLVNRGDKKCREGHPNPSVVFGCGMVLLKLCLCGRRVCFDVLMVDNNLKSVKGTQTITVTIPIQSLKSSSSRPTDLSCGFANVDFAIFFKMVLEFERVYCRVFGFAISRY